MTSSPPEPEIEHLHPTRDTSLPSKAPWISRLGLVVALLALGLAGIALRAPRQAFEPVDLGPLGDRLAAIETRVTVLEAETDNAIPESPLPDTEALGRRLSEIEARISVMEPQDPDPRLEALRTEFQAAMTDQEARILDRSTAQRQSQLAALEARLQQDDQRRWLERQQILETSRRESRRDLLEEIGVSRASALVELEREIEALRRDLASTSEVRRREARQQTDQFGQQLSALLERLDRMENDSRRRFEALASRASVTIHLAGEDDPIPLPELDLEVHSGEIANVRRDDGTRFRALRGFRLREAATGLSLLTRDVAIDETAIVEREDCVYTLRFRPLKTGVLGGDVIELRIDRRCQQS